MAHQDGLGSSDRPAAIACPTAPQVSLLECFKVDSLNSNRLRWCQPIPTAARCR